MAWTIRNTRTGYSKARFETKEEAEKAWRATITKWPDLALVTEVVEVALKDECVY